MSLAHATINIEFETRDQNGNLFDPDTVEVGVVSPEYRANDVALTAVVGMNAVLTSQKLDLRLIKNGDYIQIAGFATTTNNGEEDVWQATADGTRTSVAVTKLDGVAPVAEVAGRVITLKTETKYVYDGIIPEIENTGTPGVWNGYFPTRSPGKWQVEVIARHTNPPIETREIFTRKFRDNAAEN